MYFNINDFTLYYEEYGTIEHPNILILPGWGETRVTFSSLIKSLQENYHIYIIDYPGFGNSPFPHRDLTIYDYTNLIIDFLNIEQITDPIIIAHSFGGRIAITLNGYFQYKIKKMILIGSAGIRPQKTLLQKIRQAIYKLLKKCQIFFPYKRRKKYLQILLHLFGSSDYQQLNPNERKTFIQIVNEDLSCYLHNITASTLLLWGEHDTSTPLKYGEQMAKTIPDAGLVVFRSSGHFCYMEQPLLTYNIITEFLDEKNTD